MLLERFFAGGICSKMLKFAFGAMSETMGVLQEVYGELGGVWNGVMAVIAVAIGGVGDEGEVIGR